ncbi:MAG: hypothetical protein QM751_05815 [Paludibacteraceae bacterium]
MGRIFIYGDESYDLGNIKHINTTPFSGGYGGCYVNIHLLKGNEYVFNEETETTELIEPKIVKGFGEDRYAMSFIKTISEEWEKYLESKEIQENNY